MDKETIPLRSSFEWSSQVEFVTFYNANVSCWAQVWGMEVPQRFETRALSFSYSCDLPAIKRPRHLGKHQPIFSDPKNAARCRRNVDFLRNTVDRLQTDGLPEPTEAGSQHQHRWGQGWEGQPVSRSGFTFEESPEIAFSWVHDLSFFPCQIRNSPGNAIHCSFFLIEIMSPKPLVASNSFIHESRSFPSGDYQHLKERSSNPCDQGKTVQHQLCLVSGARNSKLLFLPPGPGRLLAS